MKILLVAATLFEIRPFLDRLAGNDHDADHVRHFQLKNTSVDVLVTGVGMVPAAYCIGKKLAASRYDMAVNAGIGGSYSRKLEIGEVVHVVEECMPELGAENETGFLTLFDLELADPYSPPYSEGRLINNIRITAPCLSKLKQVRGATCNTIHGNSQSIKRIRDLFDPEEESMEGAACFHAFLMENIPFAEIRAISNYVEMRGKASWNMQPALTNLNDVIWEFFQEVCV